MNKNKAGSSGRPDITTQTKSESDDTGTQVSGLSERLPLPRLSEYYSDANVRPAAFTKAVRLAKIRSFAEQDVVETMDLLPTTDPALARTGALLIGKTPDAIARWVIDATKASLKHYHPDLWSHASEAADILFDRIVERSAVDLTAKDKNRRVRAENLLRLSMAWLINQRNLDPKSALLSVRRARRRGRSTADAGQEVARLLKQRKLNPVLDLATVAGLFESAIAKEMRERQQVYSRLSDLRDRIVSLESSLQSTQAELESAKSDSTNLSQELEAVQNELSDVRQLGALDLSQQAAKFRTLLIERVSLPLSDARDALDFDTPHVEAARQRINMALRAIGEELDESDE